MEFKDYYKTLGLSQDAPQEEVKRAYRRLARKFHPDVSKEPDAENRFKEVNEAYEVLKDPEKRSAYDRLGSEWKSGQDFRPPPEWDAGFEFRGGGFTDADTAGFSDFFETLFGAGGPFRSTRGTRGRGAALRGEDHHAKVLIDLEDAYRGATRQIRLEVPELDPRGRVTRRTRTLQVRIPKGVTAGQHIRLAGQGAPGPGGGPAGDLYLEIAFRPHPRFEVHGRDIYCTLPVTPWEAALGGRVQAPTLGGPVDLQIPPGSQSGRKLRLKGRGLPGRTPGDQYVVLQIVTPPADTEAAQRFYEQMARTFSFDPRTQQEG